MDSSSTTAPLCEQQRIRDCRHLWFASPPATDRPLNNPDETDESRLFANPQDAGVRGIVVDARLRQPADLDHVREQSAIEEVSVFFFLRTRVAFEHHEALD